jgi:Flp pilus assembly pilin Flp
MKNGITRFWDDTSGAEMVEWAVVTVLLLSATALLLISLRDVLIGAFVSALKALEAPPPQNFP